MKAAFLFVLICMGIREAVVKLSVINGDNALQKWFKMHEYCCIYVKECHET